jgi:hypothetical protein
MGAASVGAIVLWIALCERTPALQDEVITEHRATRDDFNICGSVVVNRVLHAATKHRSQPLNSATSAPR